MERSQSSKRKFPFSGLQRRVRARKDEEPEIESDSNPSEEEVSGDDDDDQDSQGSGEDEEDGDDQSGSSEDDDEDPSSLDPSQISFGALAKAQASMPKRRKHARKGEEDDEDSDNSDVSEEDTRGGGADGFGGRESERKHALQKRSSKHAPMEVTAKRAVTRKREVVSVPKVVARDPRFGPLGTTTTSSSRRHPNPAMEEEATRRNYAFLDKYRDDEMAELKKEVKKARDPAAKEKLQRAVMSMQSRKQMLERRDAERAVVAEHRRQEKELVKQGKQPFYLKKSEQKKRVIMDRFAGMKKGQVDKAIERKRKKLASKERREMPMERRER
ncbi:hypothetical protein PG999_010643 [Apiospora kogelbergensis]|uniref:rRNA biogenesis protein RRP36 n=1 Tax=Apiospora kogelbergensis TaxID=1337665 RepID=A0AAW0QDH5_9PEZI